MSETLTREEWLAEMERVSALQRSDDEGWTMTEWAEQMQCSNRMATERLRKAHRAGRLLAGKRNILSINGRRIQTDVYRLKPAE